METEATKCHVDRKCFEIEKKELILESERLLEHIICQDVMNVVMHADVNNVLPMPANSLEHHNHALDTLKMDNGRLMELLISQDIVHTHVNNLAAINDYKTMEKSYIDEYNKNLVLIAELAKKNDMIEQAVYNELSKRCFSLEIELQQSKEIFHINRSSLNQNAPDIQEFFKTNEWQAKLDAKDLSIAKLREHIMNLKGKT
ncbi:hypothetical protein Tco_0275789 [Tanacetum coccineum]